MPSNLRVILPLGLILIAASLASWFFFFGDYQASKLVGEKFVYEPKRGELVFSIRPPKEWKIVDVGKTSGLSRLASFESDTRDSSDETSTYSYRAILDISVVEKTDEKDIGKLVDEHKEPIARATRDIAFVRDQEAVVGGQKARVLEWKSRMTVESLEGAIGQAGRSKDDIEWLADQPTHSLYYFFLKDGFLYSASGSTFEKHWNEFSEAIEASIKTFRFR